MFVTSIPEDYDGLKKEYLILRKELDSLNQELYGCKRQLKIVEGLQHEYQSEIEMLQLEENTQIQVREEKIAQLEETVGNVRSKLNEQIQCLEFQLLEKQKDISDLQSEVEVLKKSSAARTSTEDTIKLIEEVVELKQEKEVLLKNEKKLKSFVEIFQKNNLALEESLIECREVLSNLKENFVCKRDELFEANDLIRKLNDDLYWLKTELKTYKSKPLTEESRGNSLFAEEDDRLVFLQKTIKSMRAENICMKQERAKHLNTISDLRSHLNVLAHIQKKDMEEKEDDEHVILKAYKERIQVLGSLLNKCNSDNTDN